MTNDNIGVQDRVELLKSVRASGVVLDAGLLGSVIVFNPIENCEIRFDGVGGTFAIKLKFLRKLAAV